MWQEEFSPRGVELARRLEATVAAYRDERPDLRPDEVCAALSRVRRGCESRRRALVGVGVASAMAVGVGALLFAFLARSGFSLRPIWAVALLPVAVVAAVGGALGAMRGYPSRGLSRPRDTR